MNDTIKIIIAATIVLSVGFIVGFAVAAFTLQQPQQPLQQNDNGRYQSLKLVVSEYGQNNVVFDTRTGQTYFWEFDLNKPQPKD